MSSHRFSSDHYKDVAEKYYLDENLLTHDDDSWYYDGKWTCVSYRPYDECMRDYRYMNVCPTKNKQLTSTEIEDQLFAVRQSIENGGEHPQCPTIYDAYDIGV
jgi:hypothetical protein